MDPVTMGLIYGGGISSATGLAQGLLTWAGGEQQNKRNRQLAYNQMGFQERMSNTAYQRAVSDARSAGLNPALMYSQGGASSPVGASAGQVNAIGEGVSAYQQAKNDAMMRRESFARADLADEQRRTTMSQADLYDAQREQVLTATQLAKLEIPAAENLARMERTRFGQYAPYVERGLGMAGGLSRAFAPFGQFMNSARAAARPLQRTINVIRR